MTSSFYKQPAIRTLFQNISKSREQGKKIILATGVFDLLHEEHKEYLRAAKEVGDLLVVAIESDVRVRQMKGPGRPIHGQSQRLQAIRAIKCVDIAFILPEDFKTTDAFRELLRQLQPHIYACSSHSSHMEVKRALMKEIGGEVRIVREHNPDVSTSKILERSVQ